MTQSSYQHSARQKIEKNWGRNFAHNLYVVMKLGKQILFTNISPIATFREM
jgi:hypothetical protein